MSLAEVADPGMFARYIYLWWRNRRVQRFLHSTRRARRVQLDVLLDKLRRHADSDFGRRHGFAAIRSVDDFRRQVPITNYEYYRPYIERLKQGDVSAMFGPGTQLLMFALTSGTTSDAKYVPVTQQFFNEYRDGWNMWGVRTYVDHLDLCHKKTLQFTSNWNQFLTPGGTPCGNISGLAAETAPLISNPVFIIPRKLMKIVDPIAKRYTGLRLSLPSRRVGMIITANPSTLIELARLADTERESLIRDIHDGTLSERFDVPGPLRDLLHRRIRRRRPKRARELERIAERTGRLYPQDFWPRMAVIAVWTGGSVGSYVPRVREYYGERPVFRDHGLHASEGRMTVPFCDGTSAGVLDFVHTFFEFIPEEEHDSDNPTVLEAHELEEGRNYYILLTTSSGLYRYDIHDLVRCTGFIYQAPVLEFLNKGAHFASVTGEKLSEFQAVTAVNQAFGESKLPIELFTLAPEFGDPPRYVLLVERPFTSAEASGLANRVDSHLATLNCEYEERRRTGRLGPLTVREVPAGTWDALRQTRVSRLGGSLEQYKHPCLSGDLGFIDRLPKQREVA